MCVSVSEAEVPKEKVKSAPVKKGCVFQILIENDVHVHYFIFFVNNVDP